MMAWFWCLLILSITVVAAAQNVEVTQESVYSPDQCPGYILSNFSQIGSSLHADLTLAGAACNTYGADVANLTLEVEYQTDRRIRVLVYDREQKVYQVPESVFPRPKGTESGSYDASDIVFTYTERPFSFAISRRDGGETLFNTSGSPLIFQSQYLRLKTVLPSSPALYGLGEHSDPFMLNTTNYTRTLWSRDAYGIPRGTNLYGVHPVYFDHRGSSGTHGVFLLNSNGMDVKINHTSSEGQYLEYNVLGGVLDLYFMAGPSPKEVAAQYAQIVGLPTMQPYFSFGFHQCRYGYRDVFEVAEVVYNYSKAEIPLETMWTDIDYMDGRKVFTTDPRRFPLKKMRELVAYLHTQLQHYVVMVDPAVAYQNYSAFNDGEDQGVFLKRANGTLYQGVVWPGPTVFPDWFANNTQAYWASEFQKMFGSDDIYLDGLWIDMNEASNFCDYPCVNPAAYAEAHDFPPVPPDVRPNPRLLPGFPTDFQPDTSASRSLAERLEERQIDSMMRLHSRDFINPPYAIGNAAGSLSNRTLDTDLVHENGLVMYDTHNLYGSMMSTASREAMLSIRTKQRPFVITRSTFAGAGTKVGHWLGDNWSNWDMYRTSISGMLNFASIFQIPMVGSDVCGFSLNTSETLCARWAMLGAFNPFYRNHNDFGSIPQEFYRWASVASAARKAIEIRYMLLDYIYTALYVQTVHGNPLISPLFFIYPTDGSTFPIDLQFFYGDAILVSPVTVEDSTSVSLYLPDDVFYDYYDHKPIRGNGSTTTLHNISYTTIPLHIRGGTIIPMRNSSANTTTILRKNDFSILVAPGLDGTATGYLYLDDGRSLNQNATSIINFTYTSDGTFLMGGIFDYDAAVMIQQITILGIGKIPSNILSESNNHNSIDTATTLLDWTFDKKTNSLTIRVEAPLTRGLHLQISDGHQRAEVSRAERMITGSPIGQAHLLILCLILMVVKLYLY